ncbi:hypothetical protein [Burkholderia cenocepacia]|uniref:hypothetical protein n=1 Tax=Burkholderia cenocepacia TaxID=95486 RepID=UPI002B252975|nr:hypothetical protein [Burkholderia cenocepacia]MEB2554094.1 hypothetical protein [Burkholderia cenocepacia]
MDEHGLTAARDAATAYAREHARELATELMEWSDTTLLRDGRVRELARMLQVLDAAHALTLARSFAERAALELTAGRAAADREAIIEECAKVMDDRAAEIEANDNLTSMTMGRIYRAEAERIRALKTAPTPAQSFSLTEDDQQEGVAFQYANELVAKRLRGDKGGA